MLGYLVVFFINIFLLDLFVFNLKTGLFLNISNDIENNIWRPFCVLFFYFRIVLDVFVNICGDFSHFV